MKKACRRCGKEFEVSRAHAPRTPFCASCRAAFREQDHSGRKQSTDAQPHEEQDAVSTGLFGTIAFRLKNIL